MSGVGSGSNSPDAPFRAEFDTFALRASPSLLRSAYVLTGDRGHAEDLLQTTLLRTAQRWRAARESPDACELPDSDRRSEAVGDQVERMIERDAVTQAVRRLPARQREVVVLRFFLDLSIAQTAVALGASEGTVKSHTARALERMRELLTDTDPVPEDVSTEVHHAD
jgi:DNA-directed RNA polymerase specialized sigma24 family protein